MIDMNCLLDHISIVNFANIKVVVFILAVKILASFSTMLSCVQCLLGLIYPGGV